MELIEWLAKATGYDAGYIHDLAKNSESAYNVFYIRKKGGKREIAEPREPLMKVMRALNDLIFRKLKVSKYATAYNKGDGILKNASRHKRAEIVYSFDLKSFFPSIAFRHVSELLSKKYGEKNVDLIWRLVSYKKGLPIGAPTSPFICNAVCYKMDLQIAKRLRRAVYTRYADDLTVSYAKRKHDKRDVPAVINRIVRDHEFRLNDAKTRAAWAGRAKCVTGLTITAGRSITADRKIDLGGRVTVGHKYKDALKKQIYNLLVLKKGHRQKIAGRLNFVRQIEPDYARRLAAKYERFDEVGFFE
ncbi:hypothetical protein FACS1894211_02710 [Clostridia bacterium]|nr:hypothetical protein FACS1894211_02710 [Clostridia bacterium]